MLNHIVMQGRLTRDPEMRTTQAGVAVANFGIACDHDWTEKDSNERGVDFVNCVAWRGSAEFICRNFRKGQMCVVSGRLQIRDWTDKDNIKRQRAEIAVEKIYFCGRENAQGGSERAAQGNEAAPAGKRKVVDDFAVMEGEDSELPF